jgi:hypothetical protein
MELRVTSRRQLLDVQTGVKKFDLRMNAEK